MSNLGDDLWKSLEQVMSYLSGITTFGIDYSGCPPMFEWYSDSNWISYADETKATSGCSFTLTVGVVVAWRSYKQTILAIND
jgi:hypothetical protein